MSLGNGAIGAANRDIPNLYRLHYIMTRKKLQPFLRLRVDLFMSDYFSCMYSSLQIATAPIPIKLTRRERFLRAFASRVRSK